ncbi:MAG: class IV adenylate cyclase [Gemmatimonadaceae bacterium]|nr:class IV adenylate cyclase [Gemmatimonadaceae bacterium]
MREVELKAVVADISEKAKLLDAAGAKLVFEGALRDCRYDTADRSLGSKDEVIRVRTYQSASSSRAVVDWKGPVDTSSGYKVREEISAGISDSAELGVILEKLGYDVVKEIDRRIVQYELGGATIRFEEYPRMDTLVEVEGSPVEIENAIGALGMSRGEFTNDSLSAFVGRFERRTGVIAATSESDLART